MIRYQRQRFSAWFCEAFYFGLMVSVLAASPAIAQITQLTLGQPLERELAGGQSHAYQLTLEAGQYCRLTVEQKGVDLVVRLIAPKGNLLVEVDSSNEGKGTELLPFVASEPGRYQVLVIVPDKQAGSGRYEIKLGELRPAEPTDENRSIAEREKFESERLSRRNKAQDSRQARVLVESAAKRYQLIGDKLNEAQALYASADINTSIAEYQLAETAWLRALPLFQALSDKLWEANTLTSLAGIRVYLGDWKKAKEYVEQALAIQRQINDPGGEASGLNALAVITRNSGDPVKATEYYEQALQALRRVPNRDNNLEATILSNIGNAQKQIGELQKALTSYNEGLAFARQHKTIAAEAIALRNLGELYYQLGDYQQSLEFSQQSLTLFRQTGEQRAAGIAMNSLGLAYSGLGNYAKALEAFQQSFALAQAVKTPGSAVIALGNIGSTLGKLGDYDKALESLNRSLELLRTVNERVIEAATLNTIGQILLLRGESDKSLEHHQLALKLSLEIKSTMQESYALLYLARVKQQQGELPTALNYFERALHSTESLRAKLGSNELKTLFLAQAQDRYAFYIEALMQAHAQQPNAGHAVAALHIQERSLARGLLDLLSESSADRQGLDGKLLAQGQQIRQQLNFKANSQTRLLSGKHTPAQAEIMAQEVTALTTQLQAIETQIRITSPRYAALTQPQPLAAEAIQKQLDDDTLLLEFALGEKQSYLWVVSAREIKNYQLTSRAEITAAARKVYGQFTSATASQPSFAADTQALSKMLLGAATPHFGKKRLVIVAPGILSYVPFGILPDPLAANRPLLANHEIISLPSASVLATLRKELTGRAVAPLTVAVLGDPVFSETDVRVKNALAKQTGAPNKEAAKKDSLLAASLSRAVRSVTGDERAGLQRLLFSRDEAEAIAAVAPAGSVLKALDFQASRAMALSDKLANYRIIHFATHGLLDSAHPELSGLALSQVDEQGNPQDGYLRLNEIYNLKLNADLVVLSACQTGLGKEIKGEGLIGLTRGFMYAGAPRVVASLWQVNDAATAELMKRFYRGMLKEKLRPAAALRQAQLELMKKPAWRAPYYWGAFVLQGEWK